MVDGTRWISAREVAAKRIDPDTRYGLRLTLFATGFLLLAIPFMTLLAQVITDGPLTEIDQDIAIELVQVSATPERQFIAELVSLLGKPIFLAVVVGATTAWIWLKPRQIRIAIYLLATSLGGGLVDTVAKAAVGRPRPDLDGPVAAFGNSFPSGHVFSSVVCYGAVILVLLPYLDRNHRRLLIVAGSLLVTAIAMSRLVLGVHYLSDVLAGFVLGTAWLLLATAAFSIWRVERHEEAIHVDSEGITPEEPAPDANTPPSLRPMEPAETRSS